MDDADEIGEIEGEGANDFLRVGIGTNETVLRCEPDNNAFGDVLAGETRGDVAVYERFGSNEFFGEGIIVGFIPKN